MNKEIDQAPQEDTEITEVEVQRLTRKQLLSFDPDTNIPERESCIVALGRNKEGVVVRTEVVEGVNEKDFLHGEGNEYFDLILGWAEDLLDFKNKA